MHGRLLSRSSALSYSLMSIFQPLIQSSTPFTVHWILAVVWVTFLLTVVTRVLLSGFTPMLKMLYNIFDKIDPFGISTRALLHGDLPFLIFTWKVLSWRKRDEEFHLPVDFKFSCFLHYPSTSSYLQDNLCCFFTPPFIPSTILQICSSVSWFLLNPF